MFDAEECVRCGICLESCPVIDLNENVSTLNAIVSKVKNMRKNKT